ncbi:uncharacterized protein LOC136034891 [Artemia franciscana]
MDCAIVKQDRLYCKFKDCRYSEDFPKGGDFFYSRSNLENHIKRAHLNQRYTCEECRSTFPTSERLSFHKLNCGITFECKCGRSFISVDSYQSHCNKLGHPFVKNLRILLKHRKNHGRFPDKDLHCEILNEHTTLYHEPYSGLKLVVSSSSSRDCELVSVAQEVEVSTLNENSVAFVASSNESNLSCADGNKSESSVIKSSGEISDFKLENGVLHVQIPISSKVKKVSFLRTNKGKMKSSTLSKTCFSNKAKKNTSTETDQVPKKTLQSSVSTETDNCTFIGAPCDGYSVLPGVSTQTDFETPVEKGTLFEDLWFCDSQTQTGMSFLENYGELMDNQTQTALSAAFGEVMPSFGIESADVAIQTAVDFS